MIEHNENWVVHNSSGSHAHSSPSVSRTSERALPYRSAASTALRHSCSTDDGWTFDTVGDVLFNMQMHAVNAWDCATSAECGMSKKGIVSLSPNEWSIVPAVRCASCALCGDIFCGYASGRSPGEILKKSNPCQGMEIAPTRDEGQSCSNPCQLTTSYHIKGTQRGDYSVANFWIWFNFWLPEFFVVFFGDFGVFCCSDGWAVKITIIKSAEAN